MFVNPEMVAAAVPDLANIGSTISDANAAAAASTTGLVPAAEDEISAAIRGLFNTYAQDYHDLVSQAAALHARFAQAVGASAGSYVAAEAANVGALLETAKQDLVGLVNAPAQAAAQVVQITAAQPIPENGYPFGGVKQLTNAASITLGLQELDLAVQQALPQAIAQGNTLQIYGYSQSAVIASLEMSKLQAEGVPGGPNSPVSFLIVGDPMNPNGGFYERFAGLNVTSLGFNFYGATPSNAYPTKIITIEYDSYADYPRYPLDILSDLNSVESTNHFYYHILTQQQVDNGIILPTSGPTQTTYVMIPATQLPLLNPIRQIPIIGNPIADLLQPDMTYLVNLGYGNPLYGWSTGPANVPTQAGLLPPLSSFEMMPGLLASGAQQGFQTFIADFTGTGPNPVTLGLGSLTHSLTSLYSSAAAATSSPLSQITGLVSKVSSVLTDPAALQSTLLHIPNAISQVVAVPYTDAIASLEVANAALIGIPSYDINLFLDGMLQAVNGQPLLGLVNAVGQPIASDIGLYLWLTSLESTIITNPTEAAGPATGVPGLGVT